MTSSPIPDSVPWLILSSSPGPAAENMAWDEALLEFSAQLGAPILRFYGWKEPAASFGYFQRYQDITRQTALRPLVRRPTGGGLVPHDSDWTYSIVAPPWHDWYALRAEQSYERAHRWVRTAFARIGVETSLAEAAREEAPGQCFAGHVKGDLLRDGRKLAGAAQRRNKHGLLIQGSVHPPVDKSKSRHAWEAALMTTATGSFGAAWQLLHADEALHARVAELTATKYALDEYNRRR